MRGLSVIARRPDGPPAPVLAAHMKSMSTKVNPAVNLVYAAPAAVAVGVGVERGLVTTTDEATARGCRHRRRRR
jgi:hypothetical protein